MAASLCAPGLEQEHRHRALALDLDVAPWLREVAAVDSTGDAFGDLDLARHSVALHPARGVHRVAPQVVDEPAAADHPGHDGARVDADPQLEPVAIAHDIEHRDGHVEHRLAVVLAGNGDPSGHHVGI